MMPMAALDERDAAPSSDSTMASTPADSQNSASSIIPCPCKDFGTVQAIRSALDSDQCTHALVTWLSENATVDDTRQLSCQPRPNLRCAHRVSASFSILNGIRDACRPFLESGAAKDRTSSEPTYEEAFPSLSTQPAAAPIVARKKVSEKDVTKAKRRICPAPVLGPAQGNISVVPSTYPMPMGPNANSEKAAPCTTERLMHSQLKKSSASEKASAGSGKVKRRIRPALASEWGAAAAAEGNISMLPSTDPLQMRASVQRPKNSQAQKVNASKPVTADSEKAKRRIRPSPAPAWGEVQGNISILSSTDSLPMITGKVDSDKMVPRLSDDTQLPANYLGEVKLTSRTSTLEASIEQTDSKQNGTVHVHGTVTSESKRTEARQNLARIYSTLICCHLVPSTALELHLMIRLLTVRDDSTVAIDLNETAVTFRTLFASASCCQSFAVEVLTQITCILRNLDLNIISSIITCPPFVTLLPHVTKELAAVAKRRRESSLLLEVDSVSIVGTTYQIPLLTLPFDHDRDSRHNYKTREEMAIYKNREESRDAFLYQLRAFQNIRGKVLDEVQAERSFDRIRTASRNVMQGLLKANMFWFAQLFCDLLTQIGLVPTEETDKEVLDITDKDKLQKLHKRFSSKGTQTSKSSKNLVLDPSKDFGTGSPVVEAQQYFPGHQEFFFIFIMSTDCYSFGVHLKNRLKVAILSLLSSDAAKGLEKRLSHLQLLSRFLGLLVFSPTWHEQGLMNAAQDDEVPSFDPEIPLLALIETAWKKRHLVIIVPWVVEFLRMSRWSQALRKSKNFKRLLSLLLGIHYRIANSKNEASDSACVNMQQVSLCFETLFGDVIGLERAVLVPVFNVTEQDALPADPEETNPLDALPLRLSKLVLFTCNPHVEELFSLLSSLTQNQTKSCGASRKLTPYSIGGGINASSIDPLRSSVISPSPVKSTRSLASDIGAGQSAELAGAVGNSAILAKLVEAFFHQHRDLKELCEFIVDQALKNVGARMREECVVPFLENRLSAMSDAGTESGALRDAEERAIEASRVFLASHLERSIRQSLDILCPPGIQPRVRDVAAKLSISHAIRLGESTVDSLVRLESKKLALEKSREANKQATALKSQGQVDTSAHDNRKEWIACRDALSALRDALASSMWESRPVRLAAIVTSAKDSLREWKDGGFAQLRGFLGTIESRSVPLLQWCLRKPPSDAELRWKIAADFLGVITLLAESMGDSLEMFNAAVNAYFADEGSIDAFIELGFNDGSEDHGFLCGLLVELMTVKMISPDQLQAALAGSLHESDRGRILCSCFQSHVDKHRNEGKTDSDESLMILRQNLENL